MAATTLQRRSNGHDDADGGLKSDPVAAIKALASRCRDGAREGNP
jgi:hypothetical protein